MSQLFWRPARRTYCRAGIIMLILGVASLATQTHADPSSDPDRIHDLHEISSINGVLSVTLEAADQKVQIGQASFDGSIYNGDYAGPVLRVHPGDVMKIRLINHCAQPNNIHFHGIDTSPQGNGDNIHILVKPGGTFDYEVKIPLNQPPGLYWYHDHIHGITERNVMAGLSGTLIVEGFAQQFPELATVKEQIFVLKDYLYDNSTDTYVTKYLHKLLQTINGQTFSKIYMQPGETQLWRVTNKNAGYYFDLSLPGHKFRVIGDDGVAALKETEVDKIKIKPASRLEILVDAGDRGVTDLISEGVVTGDGADKTSDRILGQVIVSGWSVAPTPLITSFPAREDLMTHKIDASRVIVFSQSKDNDEYYVNGVKFDHNRIDTRVPLGNTEEWTLRNDSDELHVFHIHQVSFQVTEINGEPVLFNSYVDNVRVPERGSVKIRIPFTNPTMMGTFVYHCHVLGHEDKGMMAQIEVYDPKVSTFTHFWRELFTCCSSMKFNGGCAQANIRRYFLTLLAKAD